VAGLVSYYDQFLDLDLELVAISAELPEESIVMKKRQKAPFLYLADKSLELINAFQFRDKKIAQPGFVLLHWRKIVWERREMKFLRQKTSAIFTQIQKAQLMELSQTTANQKDS